MFGAVGRKTRQALISYDCAFQSAAPTSFQIRSRLGMRLTNETARMAITEAPLLIGAVFLGGWGGGVYRDWLQNESETFT